MLAVVIIDGNAISRNLLSSVLTNGGHHVIGDGNASSASIARMLKLRPQVVCIDIGQVDSEGTAMLDTIRESLPKALIFIVSGKIEPAMVELTVAHGVQGFIVKPFNSATVLTTIRNAVLKFARQQRTKTAEE